MDREVIELTKSRDQYVDALLAIAGATYRLDLAPAPLFLRKRHLKQRVVSILKEVRMSKTRSVSALAAGLGILAAACWFVTAAFPLMAKSYGSPAATTPRSTPSTRRTVISSLEFPWVKGRMACASIRSPADTR